MKQTRAEAQAAGADRYFTGKLCKYGHVAPRYTISGNCTECITAFNADFYAANADAQRARSAAFYADNKAYFSEYYAGNTAAYRVRDQKRRAIKRKAVPSWFGELDELVMIEAADLCAKREAATGFSWHIDHAIPLQAEFACGLHVAQNIQVIPAQMNYAKNNRMTFTEPGEWIKHA